MNITYYGHACFGIELQGKSLLFDPFIRPNELARHLDMSRIPADYILISHGHADHIADAEEIAQRTGALVISNFEITQWLEQKAGITHYHPMNHGGAWQFDFGRVKYVNAIHSSMLPDGSNGGNPGGFVIESKQGNFYYSGDTALTWDMKLIGEATKLNLALLCLGDNFTMGIEDAIRAAEFIQCNRVIGMHYDTFPPIKIDHEKARQRFQQAGKELILLPIGERMDLKL